LHYVAKANITPEDRNTLHKEKAELKGGMREGLHLKSKKKEKEAILDGVIMEFKFIRNVYSYVLIKHCTHI